MLTFKQLSGQVRDHILQFSEPPFAAAPLAAKAFLEMRHEARKAGLELSVFSGFRDYKSQLRIWQLKAQGKRPLLDLKGQPLERAGLTAEEVVLAILRWSALPGASRHHWGSELDLIDLNPLADGYRVRLVQEEYDPQGVFGPLNEWLDHEAHRFGFFRPYRSDQGGVAPEPWHLSFAELSVPALEQLSLAELTQLLEASEFAYKPLVLSMLPDLFERFVLKINGPCSEVVGTT